MSEGENVGFFPAVAAPTGAPTPVGVDAGQGGKMVLE